MEKVNTIFPDTCTKDYIPEKHFPWKLLEVDTGDLADKSQMDGIDVA